MAFRGSPGSAGCERAELEREGLERDGAQNGAVDSEDGEQDFGPVALESGAIDAGSASGFFFGCYFFLWNGGFGCSDRDTVRLCF